MAAVFQRLLSILYCSCCDICDITRDFIITFFLSSVSNDAFKVCAHIHFSVSSLGSVSSEFKIIDMQPGEEHVEAEEALQCFFF